MKNIIFLIVLFASVMQIFAYQLQNQPDYLPDNSPLFKEIKQEIFDKLINVIGAPTTPLEFRILKKDANKTSGYSIAWINYERTNNTTFVNIEEKAINLIFDSFTEQKERYNSIAFLIAHELAHYYHYHLQNLISNKLIKDVHGYGYYTEEKQNTRWQYDTIVSVEKEADYFGGFYSYLAGFNISETASKCIDIFYLGENYNLKEKEAELSEVGYLKYEERRAIADSTAKFLRERIPEFELANKLYITRQYRLAAITYEKILKFFPSKDILNNLGVCYAQIAMEVITDTNITRFKYPFAFETASEIERLIPKAMLVDTLKLAIDCFQRAIALDSAYWIARINLSCAYIMRGSNETALTYINKILDKLEANQLSALALTAKGIALWKSKPNTSKQTFRDALKADSNLDAAKYNLSLVNGNEKYVIYDIEKNSNINFKKERICGAGHDSYIRNVDLSLKGDIGNHLRYTFRENTGNCIDIDADYVELHQNVKTTSRIRFLNSINVADISAQGIKIGDSFTKVLDLYKGYSYSAYSADKKYYIYEVIKRDGLKTNRHGIIFEVNSENKVSGWTLFEIE